VYTFKRNGVIAGEGAPLGESLSGPSGQEAAKPKEVKEGALGCREGGELRRSGGKKRRTVSRPFLGGEALA